MPPRVFSTPSSRHSINLTPNIPNITTNSPFLAPSPYSLALSFGTPPSAGFPQALPTQPANRNSSNTSIPRALRTLAHSWRSSGRLPMWMLRRSSQNRARQMWRGRRWRCSRKGVGMVVVRLEPGVGMGMEMIGDVWGGFWISCTIIMWCLTCSPRRGTLGIWRSFGVG